MQWRLKRLSLFLLLPVLLGSCLSRPEIDSAQLFDLLPSGGSILGYWDSKNDPVGQSRIAAALGFGDSLLRRLDTVAFTFGAFPLEDKGTASFVAAMNGNWSPRFQRLYFGASRQWKREGRHYRNLDHQLYLYPSGRVMLASDLAYQPDPRAISPGKVFSTTIPPFLYMKVQKDSIPEDFALLQIEILEISLFNMEGNESRLKQAELSVTFSSEHVRRLMSFLTRTAVLSLAHRDSSALPETTVDGNTLTFSNFIIDYDQILELFLPLLTTMAIDTIQP